MWNVDYLLDSLFDCGKNIISDILEVNILQVGAWDNFITLEIIFACFIWVWKRGKRINTIYYYWNNDQDFLRDVFVLWSAYLMVTIYYTTSSLINEGFFGEMLIVMA